MPRDKSDEKFSLSLTPELAQVYRDEADRCYGGDLTAALSAAVEQWALDALRAHGVAPISPIDGQDRRDGSAVPVAADADWDLTDPHMD